MSVVRAPFNVGSSRWCCRPAVGPPGKADAPIDKQGRASDVRVFGIAKKEDSVGHFLGCSQAAERDFGACRVERVASGEFELAGRVGPTGLDAINADFELRDLDGSRASHMLNSRFRHVVSHCPWGRNKG